MDWRVHGYPSGIYYSCNNKTAWMTFRIFQQDTLCLLRWHQRTLQRANPTSAARRPRTVPVWDSFSVHTMEATDQELRAIHCKQVVVDKRMTKANQVGDWLPHKLVKGGQRQFYDCWVLSQGLTEDAWQAANTFQSPGS